MPLMVEGASSLRMVPVACPSASVAPVRLVTVTVKVSAASNTVSPITSTLKVALVWPAAMVWPVSVRAT